MTPPYPALPAVAELAADPAATLHRLAGHLDELHRDMPPGAALELRLDDGVLVMGRHEVPALALLFRHHDATPGARDEALRRAAALIHSGRIQPEG
jgi:hypothetical protein